VKSGSIYVKTRPNDSRPINHILSDTFHQHNALILRYLSVCQSHHISYAFRLLGIGTPYRKFIFYEDLTLENGEGRGKWQRLWSLCTNMQNRFCAYLRQKWTDLHQTNTAM